MVLPKQVAEWFRKYGGIATKNISINVSINATGMHNAKMLAEIVSRELVRRLRSSGPI